MRMLITGDLHLGITSHLSINKLIRKTSIENPDIIAIAGDIGEGPVLFDKCLNMFRSKFKDIPIVACAGNHDLWTSPASASTPELFENILPSICKKYDIVWLESNNLVLNRTAIVGSYLHYDYSAKDKTGCASVYSDEWFSLNKQYIINDVRMREQPPDKMFAGAIGDKFRQRLLAANNDENIDKIIIVTHVPCLEEQITRNPHNYEWSIGTPFFGNLSHEDYIKASPKVSHVVSAHSHRRTFNENIVRGNKPISNKPCFPLTAMTLNSDYYKPTFEIIDV